MAYLMLLDAVKTHTHVMVAFPLPACIEVMGGAFGALMNCLKLISR